MLKLYLQFYSCHEYQSVGNFDKKYCGIIDGHSKMIKHSQTTIYS